MLRHAPLPPGRCLPPSWLDDLPSLSGRWHDGVDPCRLPGSEALERCRRHWFASLGTGLPEATTTARSSADAVPTSARNRGSKPPNVPASQWRVDAKTSARSVVGFSLERTRSVTGLQPARKPGHCLEPVPARAHFGKSEGGRCGCHHRYRRRPAGADRKPGNRRNRPSRGVAGTSRRSGPRVRLVCRGKDGSASVPGTPQRKLSAKALADGVSPALSRRFAARTARSDMRARISAYLGTQVSGGKGYGTPAPAAGNRIRPGTRRAAGRGSGLRPGCRGGSPCPGPAPEACRRTSRRD
ncbi:hypothetical protein SAMN04488021_11639 [Paracoccus aminovorans]|uniref:Uncharacterized protein n=1 Tax=Paracoccus aminovorans TaxID=34004 RepID=A0A1I3APG9_9RHOB|nr:hypothetical protein JCM7685_pAMV3p0364 [Paracoccus aminovorans]SFH51944.1 hypothetical protein SAMN04488021_11639 [Paracoccus aminovorans]